MRRGAVASLVACGQTSAIPGRLEPVRHQNAKAGLAEWPSGVAAMEAGEQGRWQCSDGGLSIGLLLQKKKKKKDEGLTEALQK